MLEKDSIALIGYSGHSYVVVEAADLIGLDIVGYCERKEEIYNPYKLEYLGFEGDENFDWNLVDNFILGIGENDLRHRIGKFITSKNKKLVNIIHPTAVISTTAMIGQGNFIAINAVVNALATIGDFCILNTGSIIEHECIIGNAVHIAPGAVLAGKVKIGENTFIGANSVIRQGVSIGENVIVGAGSTVIRDIPDNQVWVGNPAKILV